MAKKIFLAVLAAIILIHGVTFAKKSEKIPMNERLKIAVEVTDATNFEELNTAEILRDKLIFQLKARELFNVLNPTAENFLAEIKTLEIAGASDIGDMVLFSSKDLELDLEKYKNWGAEYLIHCEILGLGLTTEKDSDFGLGNGIGIGIGSGGTFGVGIFSGAGSNTLRKFYSAAVIMKIIDVSNGAVVARKNFVSKYFKRRKPHKGYDDASDESYLKSLDDAAKIAEKRIELFATKNFPQYSKLKLK